MTSENVRGAGLRAIAMRVAVAIGLSVAVRGWAGEPVEAPGIAEPMHDARLSASVAGTVATNYFREGDAVEAGQAILSLDKRMEELEVARRKLLWEDSSELQAAEARVATLKIDAEATRTLMETTKSVSLEELNKRELEYKLAQAERDKIRLAEERERIEYEMAQEQLRERSVLAPFSGILTDLYLDVGEDCEPRQPLARLVDASRCHFVCNMDAGVARRLAVSQVVTLKFPGAGASLTCTGEVVYVSPVVDAASGLQRVKVVFENPGLRVAPGVAGVLCVPDGAP